MQKHKLSRRSFLTKTVIAGGMAALSSAIPPLLYAEEGKKTLTILHTNDTHSRIDPYPDNDPSYPGMGGYALRAAIISNIRKENSNVLLLDSGDILQGTPYFNVYGGEPEFKLMSELRYDAATIGNHEFDNGIDGLNEILPFANFPFVSSNYDFSLTALNNKVKSYHIIDKQGIKVGIYGLGIELKGLVSKKHYGKTRYKDPLKIARDVEKFLKEEKKCDLIICLSHLGFEYEDDKISDKFIAKNTRYTDIILGGHTHTLLNPAFVTANSVNNNVHIAQEGYAGVMLGRIDVHFRSESPDLMVKNATIKIDKKQVS